MSKQGGYTIRIKRSAARELDELDERTFERLSQAILKLEGDPRPRGCKKLRGVQEYRLRVGAYRILYSINDGKRTVEIMASGTGGMSIVACDRNKARVMIG